MARVLCGVNTPNGPCTMKIGHAAEYHRHREYEHSYWRIKDDEGNILDSGENMVPMNTAIGRLRKEHSNLIVEIEIG